MTDERVVFSGRRNRSDSAGVGVDSETEGNSSLLTELAICGADVFHKETSCVCI